MVFAQPVFTSRRIVGAAVAATLAIIPLAAPASAACRVNAGVVANLAPAPFEAIDKTMTMKDTYKAEFRWDIMHKEAIGWMLITDEDGAELGWVPAGDGAVSCGTSN